MLPDPDHGQSVEATILKQQVTPMAAKPWIIVFSPIPHRVIGADVVHDTARNWLLLIEAVTRAGPVDGKRRKELKELFRGSKAGLVFVTAFETRRAMQSFLAHISWETEV